MVTSEYLAVDGLLKYALGVAGIEECRAYGGAGLGCLGYTGRENYCCLIYGTSASKSNCALGYDGIEGYSTCFWTLIYFLGAAGIATSSYYSYGASELKLDSILAAGGAEGCRALGGSEGARNGFMTSAGAFNYLWGTNGLLTSAYGSSPSSSSHQYYDLGDVGIEVYAFRSTGLS